MTQPNAAFLIIGNEILSGRTREGNLQTLAEKLAPLGIDLVEVRIVRDIKEDIIAAVRDLANQTTYVFTCGGIGPTHDDITTLCIAEAFAIKLHENPHARALLHHHYGDEGLTSARLKMAQVPRGAKLIENPVSMAPGFWLKNVLVMAGVPNIFSAQVDSVLPLLQSGQPLVSGTLVVYAGESLIANIMTTVNQDFESLTLGSYPYFRAGNVGTSVVARSPDAELVKQAIEAIKQKLEIFEFTYEDQGIKLYGQS